ncbi:MAG: response regulator [Gemmatimonadota bacterium]
MADWLNEPEFWASHIHPDDRAEALTQCQLATREGRDHESQYRMVAADGSIRWLRDFVRIETGEDGRARRLFGAFLDVTHHRTDARANVVAQVAARSVPARILILEDKSDDAEFADREIRKALPRSVILVVKTGSDYDRALWEFAPDVIVSDHTIPGFSGREALRLARARCPGTPFILVTGSLDEEEAVEYMKAGATDYILKDRMARLGLTVASALEFRHEKKAHARAEAQYRDIFMGAPVGIARTTTDGQLLTANPALARMLGYDTTVDLASLSISRDIYVNEKDRARVIAAAETAGGEVEVQWKRKDGTVIWVQLSTQVSREDTGQVRYIEVFARDVTEQKMLAAQLRQSQRLEAIGQLAGSVAHDFNNLLTVILAASELVLSELAPNDSLRQDIEDIRDAARGGASLTRQLLAFSRNQVLSVQPVGLNDIVENIARMLQRLVGTHVELELQLEPTLGSVLADSGQIEQVIMNLVVNARDAIPASQPGVIRIETANHDVDATHASRHLDGKAGPYVRLSITDTGIGMDADTRARLFEPFFTTKEPGKGTGLGMSTVYGIVRQSGGYLAVDSTPGAGTTITAYFPRIDTAAITDSDAATAQVEPRRQTILLVEDDRAVRVLASRILGGAGFAIIEARNGPEALDLARIHTGTIDLLISDIVMPHMHGPELAARLEKERPETRVLFMSGYPRGALAEPSLIPVDHHLLKPFTADGLRSKVREVLDRGRDA